jgi:hypothetical protein
MINLVSKATTQLRLLLLLSIVLVVSSLQAQVYDANRRNAPEQLDKPYLILVSVDGMRWDFADLCDTPAIDRLAQHGLKAEALQPVFPTLTFPNHFSIATGQQPKHHGIVANDFPGEDGQQWYHYKDRSTVQNGEWYLADPIWVTAEKQGMLSAAFYFVGTEADIDGVRPTHWRAFDASVSGETRVDQVLGWLAEPAVSRPHVITLYFEDVDDHTHWSGPGSVESIDAIRRVDGYLERLLDGIDQLPHGDEVYVLLVSDHGMASYNPESEPLVLDQVVDLSGTRIVEGGPYAFIHFEQETEGRAEGMRDAINAQWSCGRALLPSDAPAAWNVSDSRRFPDLMVLADEGCGVISTSAMKHKIQPGDHGWPPELVDMRGVFYAMGPRIPAASRIGMVHASDIYPLMLAILDLPASGSIDGDETYLPSLLLPADGSPEPADQNVK